MRMAVVPAGALALAMVAWSASLAVADSKEREPKKPAARTVAAPEVPPGIEVDEHTLEVLEKTSSAGPYEVPDLEVKKDVNYAHTPEDVEPFGGVKPFKEHFLEQMLYTGPGRSLPEPEHVDSVKIGFIGPILSTVSVATGGKSHEEALGIPMLQGTRLALEEANARGGYLRRGVPFELVISNDNGLWGSSGNEIIKMAYKDKVWAILGTIDGANSHIAIRVALKAEVVVMNTGDTDPTFIETNIPWVMRAIGDDRQMGYLLVDYMYRKMGYERVGIIRASNRYGRFGVREINDGSRRLGHPAAIEMAYRVGAQDFSMELERIQHSGVDAIVHWGDAREGALILNQMRSMEMEQPYFVCDRAVSTEFADLAGSNAEGVIAGYPWDPTRKDPGLESFRSRYRERFGTEADTYAAHAYDGMSMLIWAIQVAGLNRARIRDVLAYQDRPWPGVTGEIVLGAVLDDVGDVSLARFERGEWRFYSRKDLGIPRGYIPPRDRISREEDGSASGGRSRPLPHFDLGSRPAEYSGPGREDPPPVDPSEILIAWFGPSDPNHTEGGGPWVAACMAIEEANSHGGYRGIPFRLVPVWSDNPWAGGAGSLARLVSTSEVWAVAGSIDGPSAHLAEQIAVKARLAFINPSSTDRSVNLANVPWVFSVPPGDDLLAAALAPRISQALHGRAPAIESRVSQEAPGAGRVRASATDRGSRDATVEYPGSRAVTSQGSPVARTGGLVIISATDHDSRAATTDWLSALEHAGIAPLRHLKFDSGSADPQALAARLAEMEVSHAIVMAGASESAQLVSAIREQRPDLPIFGGPSMGRPAFLEQAGAAAEGVAFPLTCDPAAAAPGFVRTFDGKAGRAPDCAAAQCYDAVTLLIEGIQLAGLNRARIRDAVRELSPWSGMSGTIRWSNLNQNDREVRLATITHGRTSLR